jgi:two-component system sensor histidine kinase BaeS
VRFLCLPFRESREGLFLKKFNSHMIFAIAFMLVIAVVISFFMANAISRPVLNVARMASLIGRGRYRIKDDVKSDITELEILIESMKRLGASLEAQEELRKRLMGDIAHELRNPLAIIKSHLEAFEDGVWEPTADRVRLTVGEIDRLSKLISDIERLTSIEETGSTEIKGSIDLSEEIRKIVEMYDPLYRAKSVTLSGEIAQGISLAADAGRIRQAVENLLSNSLRYTESGGKVSLTLERAGDKVVIRVIDTGMGISKDDIPYIFERFYRTDRSRARTSGGLGIGLSIVKAAVESHGGEVKAESEEGKGTIFSITLPLT